MKLYQVEYTWDDMPHGDIFPLSEATNEAAIEYLHKNVSMDFDDEDDTQSEFTIESLNEVTDMVDDMGNGGIPPYRLLDLALHMIALDEGVSLDGLEYAIKAVLPDMISDLKTVKN